MAADQVVSKVTYADNSSGEVILTEGPAHGGTEGTESLFKLEPGEHIVDVQGRQAARINQLLFTTSFGESMINSSCCTK